MKEDNEDDLKNKEDLHRWKAHGAGHIPLWGIFFKGSSHSRRLLFGIRTSIRSSNQMERLGLIWATYSPPPKSFLSISKTKSNQSLLKVKHFRPNSFLRYSCPQRNSSYAKHTDFNKNLLFQVPAHPTTPTTAGRSQTESSEVYKSQPSTSTRA